MTLESPITPQQARILAGDLIRILEPLAGDRQAVDAELERWCDVLDPAPFALLCIAVVQMTYADCLTPTPLRDLPADGLVLNLEERKTA